MNKYEHTKTKQVAVFQSNADTITIPDGPTSGDRSGEWKKVVPAILVTATPEAKKIIASGTATTPVK